MTLLTQVLKNIRLAKLSTLYVLFIFQIVKAMCWHFVISVKSLVAQYEKLRDKSIDLTIIFSLTTDEQTTC